VVPVSWIATLNISVSSTRLERDGIARFRTWPGISSFRKVCIIWTPWKFDVFGDRRFTSTLSSTATSEHRLQKADSILIWNQFDAQISSI
jgi:hypothetical protein